MKCYYTLPPKHGIFHLSLRLGQQEWYLYRIPQRCGGVQYMQFALHCQSSGGHLKKRKFPFEWDGYHLVGEGSRELIQRHPKVAGMVRQTLKRN